VLEGDQLPDVGPGHGTQPELVEEPVPLQGIAQEERVDALHPQESVGPGWPEDHPDLGLFEGGQGAARRHQIFSVAQDQAKHAFQAAGDGSGVAVQGDAGAVEGRAVLGFRDLHRPAHVAHAVRPPAFHLQHRRWHLLSARPREAAQVHTGVLGIPPAPGGKQADPQQRIVEGPADRLSALPAQLFAPGVKQRLQVHQHRMLARRDEVFMVHVGGAQEVEERQVAALPLVEAPDLVLGGAGGGFHEPGPAMAVAAHDFQAAEDGGEAALVRPGKEVLEGRFHGHGTGLIDELQARGERGHLHRPAAAVGVSQPSPDLDERAGLAVRREGGPQGLPVPGQVLQEFEADADPAVHRLDGQTGEHGIGP
jgi:hypothetical protein